MRATGRVTGVMVKNSSPNPGSRFIFKAHRLLYHSTLGWDVIKKREDSRAASREQRGGWGIGDGGWGVGGGGVVTPMRATGRVTGVIVKNSSSNPGSRD